MRFDIDELYSIYSKKSVANALKEYIQGTSNSLKRPLRGIKSKVRAFYDEPERVPSTFFIESFVSIQLDLVAIAEDFNDIPYKSEPPEPDSYDPPGEKEEPEPDEIPTIHEQEMSSAEVDNLAKQSMSSTATRSGKQRKGKAIDLHAFFMQVFRKKLSAYAMGNKVRDLQKAGIFSEPLGDFVISGVTSTRDNDFDWYSFMHAAKGKIIKTGYSFDVESKTKVPVPEEEILKIAQNLVPLIEKNLFVDTKYYKFLPPGASPKSTTPAPEEPESEPEPTV